jgi:hypothetical protein
LATPPWFKPQRPEIIRYPHSSLLCPPGDVQTAERLFEARAPMERSTLDFLKAIFFQREVNPFKHRQSFFQSFP